MPAIKALRRRQREIDREIASLQAEKERVARALEVLSSGDLFQDTAPSSMERRRQGGSLKQMAYTVLSDAQRALTAAQILDKIEVEFGQKIERTSMSPQLSRLAHSKFLKRSGNLWFIDKKNEEIGNSIYLLKSKGDLI